MAVLTLENGSWNTSLADTAAEWEVAALCEPHIRLSSPKNMTTRFRYNSTASGLDISGSLSVDGSGEQQSDQHRFGFPKRGWFSALFPGPRFEAQTYCENRSDPKSLYLSYEKKQELYLAASPQPYFGGTELPDLTSQAGVKLMDIPASGEYFNDYQAGYETPHPYWLQIGIPVHSSGNMQTSLRYFIQ